MNNVAVGDNEKYKSDDFLEKLKDEAAGQTQQLCEDEELYPNKKGYIRLNYLYFRWLLDLQAISSKLDLLLK